MAEKAKLNINKRCNTTIVVGACSPSFHIDERESKEIAKAIKVSGANVVLVGLGVPQQEKWIIKYKKLIVYLSTIGKKSFSKKTSEYTSIDRIEELLGIKINCNEVQFEKA